MDVTNSLLVISNSIWKFRQILVAFSKYVNFKAAVRSSFLDKVDYFQAGLRSRRSSRDTGIGGARGDTRRALAPPIFGSSVNPIPTGRG